MRGPFVLIAALALELSACTAAPPPTKVEPVAGTQVGMDFTLSTGFFAAPFPGESRRLTDGGVDLREFPNPMNNTFVESVLQLVSGNASGFGTTSGIFFQLSGPLSPSELPTPLQSVEPGASVVLLSVDPTSADYLQLHATSVTYEDDSGPFGAPHLLAVLPLQGLPLEPTTLYATVVRRTALDADGGLLGVPSQLAQLASGVQPQGVSNTAFADYQQALGALPQAGILLSELAGLTVFRTGNPTAGFDAFLQYAVAQPLPSPQGAFTLTNVYPDYCGYQTTIEMTEYQGGSPPYTISGGGWVSDATGTPVPQRQELANFLVTIPRAAMPDAGFPIVVFSSTGAGGVLPLMNRGTAAYNGGSAIVPGSGPAMFYAHAGWAGVSIDGPLEGLRNLTNGNEDALIFNINNPPALVDNIRQSALELALTAHLMPTISFPATDCPGFSATGNGPVRFDPTLEVVQGHSMGATISPLSLASEPLFVAGIFDGEGGSWIENVIYKQSPLDILPIANDLLNLPPSYSLNEHDPVLSMLQWAGEPADPPVYGTRIQRQPGSGNAKHVLMFQGIIDTYILPPIANASSLSFGLDLAGPIYDSSTPGLAQYTPLADLLPLSQAKAIALPTSGNRLAGNGQTVTAVVVQHVGDLIEDGHEEMFQTDPPKYQYGCFLQTLKAGVPTVPGVGEPFDPCP